LPGDKQKMPVVARASSPCVSFASHRLEARATASVFFALTFARILPTMLFADEKKIRPH
jgi:hypothetical protein